MSPTIVYYIHPSLLEHPVWGEMFKQMVASGGVAVSQPLTDEDALTLFEWKK